MNLYYDGDCPLCNHTAKAVRLRKSVGELVLINARLKDDRVKKILAAGYNLDEGIVIEYHDNIYHKEAALHLIATLSSPIDSFNRISAFIFRRKWLSQIFYPILKKIRQFLLWWRGIEGLHNQAIFQPVFSNHWTSLPRVFKTQYANRPYSEDKVISLGAMDISVTGFLKPFWSWLSRLGILIPNEKNIPVTVKFLSEKKSRFFIFHRTFTLTNKKSKLFVTRLRILKANEVLDIMRFGFAWRVKYEFADNRIKFVHRGYAWYFLGMVIPLPISFLIGKASGEELPLSNDEFSLQLKLQHPLFGKIIEYSGRFKILSSSL